MSEKVIKAQNVTVAKKPACTLSRFVRVPGAPLEEQAEAVSPGSQNPISLQEREKWERRVAEAGKAAYEKGLAAGMEAQKKENLPAAKALTEMIREIGGYKDRLYAEAEEELLNLALTVAEKVIHAEVTTNKSVVLAVLREAIRNVVDREGLKIYMHPRDLHFLKEVNSDFLKELEGIKNVVFQEDEALQRGGVLLEASSGEVDARLEQQLTEIKKVLKAS